MVEVADTSLTFDCNVKLAQYAVVGIPETWLADLNADRFEVHSEPTLDGYRKTTRHTRGEPRPRLRLVLSPSPQESENKE